MLNLTIDGVEREFVHGTLTWDESIYNRTVLNLKIISVDGSYRPQRDDIVELIDDVTLITEFVGFVESVTESGVGNEPIVPIQLDVQCVDVTYLAERRQLVRTFVPEGTTLHDALDDLVNGALLTDGVTLDPAQVTGPTLPYIAVDAMSAYDYLNVLTEHTGYVWEIDYDFVLRMFLPGAVVAPFNVIDGLDDTIQDIVVEPSSTMYANRVVGLFGSGDREVIDQFTGDGSTTIFPLNYYPLLSHFGVINVGGSIVDNVIVGGVYETLGDATASWSYEPLPAPAGTVGRFIRNAGPVANGVSVLAHYVSQMPVVVIVEEPSEQPPVRDVLITLPDVFDRATAEARFQEALDSHVAQPVTVRYSIYRSGLASGQSQTITVAKRNVNATFHIAEIRHTHLEGNIIRRDIVAIEGEIIQPYWGDVYHEWSELGEGGGGTFIPPVTSGMGPGAPDRSVQFNRAGTFGGDADFTYDEAGNNLIMGSGSDITATNPMGCFIFGNNGHITDP